VTFSALICGTIPSSNKFNKRPGKVTRIIQHHWASVNNSGRAALANPNTKKSVTYLVLDNGDILGQVPEEYRPWTSGGPSADNPSITIECQNSTAAPEWRVSDAAIASIARLVADIGARHGFGPITTSNYRGHREFAATACPGPYLYGALQGIRDTANGSVLAVPVAHVVPPAVVTATGQRALPFPLPAGWYFGPKSGPRESVSGWYSYRDSLRAWQTQMKSRGWGISVDGLYGPNTREVAILFQKEKGLQVDGAIGPETWGAAWTAPIT